MLEGLTSPADIKSLSKSELRALADEIRQLLISKVSATGGHPVSYTHLTLPTICSV